MKIKGIKHVFFDLDHTLWDFDKNSALTFEKIFDLLKLGIDTEEFLKAYEPINLNYWKLYREEKIDKSSLRYQRLKDTFDAVNFEVSQTILLINYLKIILLISPLLTIFLKELLNC